MTERAEEYWIVVYAVKGQEFPIVWAGRSYDEAERHGCYAGRRLIEVKGPFKNEV